DSVSKAGTAVAVGPGSAIGVGNQSVSAGAGGMDRPFDGILDDVRVYERGLSAEDIVELFGWQGAPVSPASASDPSPADGATDVPRDAVLGWMPGIYAPAVNGHIVYLSESFSDVNDGIGGTALSASSYDPGRLQFETAYYWRVDEVNAPPDSTVYPGEVWSFTTEPVGYPVDGANITATASSAGEADFGPEKTVDGSGLDDNGLHSTEPMDMWLSGSEPLGGWIQYELDKVYKLHQMWVWNSNQIFEGLFGFGLKDVTVEYSTDGVDWTALAGVPEFAQAPGTDDYAHNTTVDFGGAVAKYVRLTAASNWGGILPQYSLSEVRFFDIPVSAREPSPDTGATDVDLDAPLSWRAGRDAATHNVSVSTDEQAVIDGTAPVVSVTDASYSSTLDLGNTYFWRIDEVNDVETPAMWQGDVWSFSTLEYLVVDGFEDYNDYPPHEIYTTWLDGYENPANGSQVGYLTPPTIETTIVHGDSQSMPLLYSNTGGATYSEAARTFAVPQDWAKYGIQTLGLWFHGTSGNTGQLYVKINGVKVPYDGDAANLAVAVWQPWNIDLTALGMNLQSVTTLALGIDGNGAAGTLYVDDIRLYAYARQLITPVQPDPAGLVGHWTFDESAGPIAADSSGRGNDGTLVSDQFQWRPAQGRSGGALWCPGLLDSYVEFPTRDMSPAAGTVTLWGNLANPQPSQTRYFFGHTTIPPYGDRIQLYMDDSNTNLDLGVGGSHFKETDIMTLELETWYHIALTWDGGNYVVYVNGQEAAAGTYTDLTQLNAVADIANDGNTTGRTEGFAGLLDEVRVYDRALSYAEIAGLAGRTQPFDDSF
ncbi:MAG: LamG-like jellyroll fold domain-containing protein, partial [Planctomycetota bacterium]